MIFLDTMLHNLFLQLPIDYKYQLPQALRSNIEKEKHEEEKAIKLLMIKEHLLTYVSMDEHLMVLIKVRHGNKFTKNNDKVINKIIKSINGSLSRSH